MAELVSNGMRIRLKAWRWGNSLMLSGDHDPDIPANGYRRAVPKTFYPHLHDAITNALGTGESADLYFLVQPDVDGVRLKLEDSHDEDMFQIVPADTDGARNLLMLLNQLEAVETSPPLSALEPRVIPEWLTIPQAATHLGVSRQAIHRQVSDGRLRTAHRIGTLEGPLVILRAELEASTPGVS